MTNAASTAQKLTAEARIALVNVGTNRQGATIAHNTPAATVAELRSAGLIGFEMGLTRLGAIVRQRLMDLALETAFG